MPDPAELSKTSELNDVWVALQELGAALHRLHLPGEPPTWLTNLSRAKDEAHDILEDLLSEE